MRRDMRHEWWNIWWNRIWNHDETSDETTRHYLLLTKQLTIATIIYLLFYFLSELCQINVLYAWKDLSIVARWTISRGRNTYQFSHTRVSLLTPELLCHQYINFWGRLSGIGSWSSPTPELNALRLTPRYLLKLALKLTSFRSERFAITHLLDFSSLWNRYNSLRLSIWTSEVTA